MISQRNCDNLDHYLNDDLPAEAAACFELHLEQCAACRNVVDYQRWIDGLLNSPLTPELESPPRSIIGSFHESRVARQRRVRLIAGGLAAAAMLVVAVGWTALFNRQAVPTADHDVGVRQIAGDAPSAQPPRATFVGGSDVIAVPIESHRPDVTVVRIYPTYRPSVADQAATEESEPTTDSDSIDEFNGG